MQCCMLWFLVKTLSENYEGTYCPDVGEGDNVGRLCHLYECAFARGSRKIAAESRYDWACIGSLHWSPLE